MSEKKFALDVVLSVVFGRQMPGVSNAQFYELLRFLTGELCLGDSMENLDAYAQKALEESCAILSAQFPLFCTPEAREQFANLLEEMKGGSWERNALLIEEWQERTAALYGEFLTVDSR